MRIFAKILAFTGLTTIAIAAPSGTGNSCGRCDTLPSPQIGGNAQIQLRTSANKATGKAYKCTTFGKEVRLSTCSNQSCGLCMIFEQVDLNVDATRDRMLT